MTLSIITANTSNGFTEILNTVSWSNIGYLLFTISIIMLLFSSYRYLLGYLLCGIGYWIVVEGIQLFIYTTFALSSWHSYATALSLTWIIPSVVLTYRYLKAPANHPSNTLSAKEKSATMMRIKALDTKHVHKPSVEHYDSYIEHTPIYNNYKPRFHN